MPAPALLSATFRFQLSIVVSVPLPSLMPTASVPLTCTLPGPSKAAFVSLVLISIPIALAPFTVISPLMVKAASFLRSRTPVLPVPSIEEAPTMVTLLLLASTPMLSAAALPVTMPPACTFEPPSTWIPSDPAPVTSTLPATPISEPASP